MQSSRESGGTRANWTAKTRIESKKERRPPRLQTHGVTRKDSVERIVDLDMSGNLLISPVRSKKIAAKESTVSIT